MQVQRTFERATSLSRTVVEDNDWWLNNETEWATCPGHMPYDLREEGSDLHCP